MKALGARCVGSGPLLWQPARSWWNGFDRPGLVSKVGHHRGWCPAGGAGGNLELANGGPPGGWRLPAGEPGGVVLPVGAVH